MLALIRRTLLLALGALLIGGSVIASDLPAAAVSPVPSTTPALTAEQGDGLQYMREEEKLARDLYQTLGAQYPLPIFANIAAAEQAHMDSVGALLDRYGLADPTIGKAPGEFADPELQALYDQLLAQGSVSATAALQAGALVEETGLADLEIRLAQATQPDIRQVYTHLARGSENHLRAFARLLTRQSGTAYALQVLDPETVDATLDTGPGRGARSQPFRGQYGRRGGRG